MKNKDDIRDQFSPLLDGELSPEERASVEAALSDDAELLRELDSMKRVDDLFRAMPAVSAPDDFEVVVRERIAPPRVAAVAAAAAPPPSRNVARRRFVPMLAAAAALVVCAGIIVFTAGRGEFRAQLASAPDAELRATPAASAPAPQEAPRSIAADSATVQNEALANRAMEQVSSVAAEEAAPVAGEATLEAMPGIAGKDEPIHVADASAAAAPAAPMQLQQSMADEGEGDKRQRAKRAEDSVGSNPLGTVSTMAKPPAPASAPSTATAPAPVDAPVPVEMKVESLSASPPASAAGSSINADAIAPPPMPKIVAATPVPQSPPAANEPETVARTSLGTPMFEAPQRSAPAKTKQDAGKESGASTTQRSIGARSFTLRGGVWYERGYADEAMVALLRDSDAFRALVKDYANVEKLLTLKEAVVFKAGDHWYKMPPDRSEN